MLYFNSGLVNISRELYEAAAIDGARGWQMFRYISVPLLRPTILFVLVISVIGGFQLFVEPFLLWPGATHRRAPACPLVCSSTGRRSRPSSSVMPQPWASCSRSSSSSSPASSSAWQAAARPSDDEPHGLDAPGQDVRGTSRLEQGLEQAGHPVPVPRALGRVPHPHLLDGGELVPPPGRALHRHDRALALGPDHRQLRAPLPGAALRAVVLELRHAVAGLCGTQRRPLHDGRLRAGQVPLPGQQRSSSSGSSSRR